MTALVTGATAGIGRAFVDRLGRDGHDLVLVARTTSRLQEAAEQVCRAHGVGAEVLTADLSDRTDLARVVERAGSRERPVDLLVNNAGFGLNQTFLETTPADQDVYLDVLVRAVLHLTHAAGRAMAERGSGAICNVASIAAFAPLNTYSAHKAWVTTFSQAVAAELEAHGVRVMSLNPGFVRTEFHQRARMSTSSIPSTLWLDADDVVDVALRDLARGRRVSVPDVRYRLLGSAMRVLPDAVVGRAGRRLRARQRRD